MEDKEEEKIESYVTIARLKIILEKLHDTNKIV